MEAKQMEQLVLDCQCGTTAHKIIMVRDDWDGQPELTIYVQLHQYRQWYKRVWWSLKWIFNGAVPYGHWDCTLLDRNHALKVRNMVEEYLVDTAPKGYAE